MVLHLLCLHIPEWELMGDSRVGVDKPWNEVYLGLSEKENDLELIMKIWGWGKSNKK